MPLIFLALYTVGGRFTVNATHADARLVHESGVHVRQPGKLVHTQVKTACLNYTERTDGGHLDELG